MRFNEYGNSNGKGILQTHYPYALREIELTLEALERFPHRKTKGKTGCAFTHTT